MRPDPSLYLRALRTRMVDGGIEAVPAAAQPILRARMAETFDRLIARHEVMPGLIAEFDGRRAALANALDSECVRRGLSSADSAPGATALTGRIAAFDAQIAAQSRLLARLADTPGDDDSRTQLAALIDDAITLETEFWGRYAAAVAALRAAVGGSVALPTESRFDDESATALLRAHVPEYPAIRARNVRPVATVSSHEAYFFEVDGHPDWPPQVAMRRDRAFALTFTSLADEYAILDYASRAGFPAPRPLLFAPREPGSGKGALLMQRLPGIVQDVKTMGSSGAGIFTQLAKLLAKLHRADPASAGMAVAGNFSAERDAIAQIEFLEGLCAPARQDMPVTLAAAFAWLRLHASDLTDLRAIVHGDIDYRNILIEDGRISAMLDWELAREGSPAQDVGYCRAQIEEVMPLPAFLAAYRDAGGPDLPMADIRYFQILGYAQRASYCVRAYHAFADGLMDDFIVSTVGFIDLEAYFAIITGLIRDASRVDHGLRAST